METEFFQELRTRTQIKEGINLKNPLARRPATLVRLAEALEKSHSINREPAQFVALLALRKLAYEWKVDHKERTGRNWVTTDRSNEEQLGF